MWNTLCETCDVKHVMWNICCETFGLSVEQYENVDEIVYSDQGTMWKQRGRYIANKLKYSYM